MKQFFNIFFWGLGILIWAFLGVFISGIVWFFVPIFDLYKIPLGILGALIFISATITIYDKYISPK